MVDPEGREITDPVLKELLDVSRRIDGGNVEPEHDAMTEQEGREITDPLAMELLEISRRIDALNVQKLTAGTEDERVTYAGETGEDVCVDIAVGDEGSGLDVGETT